MMVSAMGKRWVNRVLIQSRRMQFVHMIHASVLGCVQLPKRRNRFLQSARGKKKGTLCKYTAKIDPRFDHSMEAGLGQGVCGLLHETNTAMMCLPVSDLMRSGVPIASAPDKEEDAGSENLIIAVVATAAASLFVGGIAGVGGALVMQRYMRQENPATVFPPAGDCHPSSVEQGKEEPKAFDVNLA